VTFLLEERRSDSQRRATGATRASGYLLGIVTAPASRHIDLEKGRVTSKREFLTNFKNNGAFLEFDATIRKHKGVFAWEQSRKLGVNWPPCELELAFRIPNELEKTNLKLKLKVKINAHGKKRLKLNQDEAFNHFISAKRLHTRPSSCSTGARLVAPCNYNTTSSRHAN